MWHTCTLYEDSLHSQQRCCCECCPVQDLYTNAITKKFKRAIAGKMKPEPRRIKRSTTQLRRRPSIIDYWSFSNVGNEAWLNNGSPKFEELLKRKLRRDFAGEKNLTKRFGKATSKEAATRWMRRQCNSRLEGIGVDEWVVQEATGGTNKKHLLPNTSLLKLSEISTGILHAPLNQRETSSVLNHCKYTEDHVMGNTKYKNEALPENAIVEFHPVFSTSPQKFENSQRASIKKREWLEGG